MRVTSFAAIGVMAAVSACAYYAPAYPAYTYPTYTAPAVGYVPAPTYYPNAVAYYDDPRGRVYVGFDPAYNGYYYLGGPGVSFGVTVPIGYHSRFHYYGGHNYQYYPGHARWAYHNYGGYHRWHR